MVGSKKASKLKYNHSTDAGGLIRVKWPHGPSWEAAVTSASRCVWHWYYFFPECQVDPAVTPLGLEFSLWEGLNDKLKFLNR